VAIDEQLASSVRKQLSRKAGLVESKMFGGLAFLINGNMIIGVHGNELVVRIAPDASAAALKEPDTRIFDITGRPMKGLAVGWWCGSRGSGFPCRWVRRGADYASSLPKK
jgi:hypothetical protein